MSPPSLHYDEHPPRIIACQDGIVVAEVGSVCTVIWRGEVTPARFRLQSEGLGEIVDRHREKVALLCVVEPTAKPPGRGLRRASIDMLNTHAHRLSCVAGVAEGHGVIAAIGRTVMLGMSVALGRSRVPIAFFGDVRAAARYMQPHLPSMHPDMFAFLVGVVRTNLDVLDMRASFSQQDCARRSPENARASMRTGR